MKALADYARLLRAGTALARHDVILPGEYHDRLPVPAKIAGKVLRLFGGGAKGRPGERLATALEKLGPAYIKLGQFLATRPDVFGVETTTDLSRLKDKLPPFKMSAAEKALADEPRLREEAKAEEVVDRLLTYAQQVEGLLRNASTHAAGVVIGDRPLDELVPLYQDPRSDMPAT